MNFQNKIRNYFFRFLPLQLFYGRGFREVYEFLEKSERWSRENVARYKLNRLRMLIEYAYEKVPYYSSLFKQNDISPADIKSLDDFSRLPVLTKEMIRNNTDKLKSNEFETFSPIPSKTSGTSGQPLTVYRSRMQEAYRNAVMWRILIKNGYDFKAPRVTITTPRFFEERDLLYEHDKIENNLIINTYNFLTGRFDKILEKIRSFKPKLIWAHPNMLCLLADYINENKLPPVEVNLVLTFAEKAAPLVKSRLIRAFPGKFIEHYGNRENTISCWGYGDSRFYEISTYCHLEIGKNKRIQDKPEVGDMISTSLHNYAFPLIRYNSDDVAEYLGYTESDSIYPQILLHGGRGKDMILTSKGLIVPYVSYYLEKAGFHKIKSFQIEQISLDRIVLRIVPTEDYRKDTDEAQLIEHSKKALPGGLQITVEYVNAIPFTDTGKFKPVISKLANEYLSR